MKFIRNIIDWSINIFKSIKSDNKKKLLELKNLEQKLEDQKKEQKETTSFVLTNRTFLKFWVIGIVVVFLWLFVYKSLSIIYLIFMAYVISLAMEAIIDFFQK